MISVELYVRFSVVGVHCHSLVLLPLAVTQHISSGHSHYQSNCPSEPMDEVHVIIGAIDGSDDDSDDGRENMVV